MNDFYTVGEEISHNGKNYSILHFYSYHSYICRVVQTYAKTHVEWVIDAADRSITDPTISNNHWLVCFKSAQLKGKFPILVLWEDEIMNSAIHFYNRMKEKNSSPRWVVR